MTEKRLILTHTLCSHYNIEISFMDELHKMGLIEIHLIEQDRFIHQKQIGDLEKIIRLHTELDMNLEGIDVVFNLLKRERKLRAEITALQNRLSLYENR